MINTRIVPNRADDAIRNGRISAPLHLATAIRWILELAKGRVELRTPAGWSGALKGGYHTEMQRVGTPWPRGILANPTMYHDVIEEGRRPGRMPPVAALMPWVGSKLGIPPGAERESVAFLVARKIGRVGFEGKHMVRDGWHDTRMMVAPALAKMGYRIVQSIK